MWAVWVSKDVLAMTRVLNDFMNNKLSDTSKFCGICSYRY